MITSIEESPLYRIANARSMAFFGASNSISSMGTHLLLSLKAGGYPGVVYPVHRTEDTVLDFKAYRRVEDLPEAPDLAVIVLPTRIVNDTLEACGKKGIRNAVVVTAGFREMGADGAALEAELKRIARTYHMNIVGPNCLGVANPHRHINTTFIPNEGPQGFVGLASQSGSFVTQMFEYLSGFGLGFSTAFSVGNEAMLDIVDCMEYLALCPHTKVIALYIEGIRRGRAFMDAARAISPHKPIVAFYAGGSAAGKSAGLSHTGALAGPDELYDGMFRQAGVIRAQSMVELFDFCWVLGTMPLPKGKSVVIQTHSGGPGAAAADACGRAGLVLPKLSPDTLEKLAPFIPATGSVGNPVDLTFAKDYSDFYYKIPKILLEEEQNDILLVYLLSPPQVIERALRQMGYDEKMAAEQAPKLVELHAGQLAGLFQSKKKPIIGFSFHRPDTHVMEQVILKGLPVFQGADRAARAAKALVAYAGVRLRSVKS